MSGKGRQDRLLGKIYSEGYCCLKGYLELCRARGETPTGMAEFIQISPDTIRYHFRRLRRGELKCSQVSECLDPVITELQKEKTP